MNNMKRMLESQLQATQRQLQALSSARRRISAVLQERSRVLDLVCAAIPNSACQSAYSGSAPFSARQPCHSLHTDRDRAEFLNGNPAADPLGAYTPEVEQALQEAKDSRSNSASLRRDIGSSIDRANKTQKEAHKSVNFGLTSKMAETAGLKVCLFIVSFHEEL